MQTSRQQDSSVISGVDVKKYIFKIISNWYLFVLALLIGYGYTYVKNKYVTTVYRVSAKIIVKNKETTESIMGGLRIQPEKSLNDEIIILKSYDITKQILDELDFDIEYTYIGRYYDKELYHITPIQLFLDSTKRIVYNQIIDLSIVSDSTFNIQKIGNKDVEKTFHFNKPIKVLGHHFTLKKTKQFNSSVINNNYHVRVISQRNLINKYSSGILIRQLSSQSSVLTVTLTDNEPLKASNYVNTLIKTYMNLKLQEKNEIAQSVIDFVDKQIISIGDSLTKAQDNLQNYRLENQLIDISSKGNSLFAKLKSLKEEKNITTLHIKYFEELIKDINDDDEINTLLPPSMINIDAVLIQEQIGIIEEFYHELEMLKYSVKKEIPKIDIIKYKIEMAKKELLKVTKQSIYAKELTLKEINEQINRVFVEIQKLPYTERQLQSLTRAFQSNDELYTNLLQKKADAEISKISNRSGIRVVEKALPENAAVITSRNENSTLVLIIAFFIPLAFIILKDYFNLKINDRSDIEGHIQAPIIGTIGHNTEEGKISVFDQSKSPLSESFRSLRTNIQFLLIDKKSKVLSITSTISGEGKTFCAVNLAAIIAMSNKKTLLIGMDLRRPKLHKALDMENNLGVSSFLINQKKLDELIIQTEIDNLFTLIAGPVPPNPAELIETERMNQLMQEVKQEFDYVIIDTPPIALVTDALLISKYADANIFVVRQDYSNKNVLNIIHELEGNKQIANLGIVLNDVKVGKGYGNRYAYKYGYKYGYGQDYYGISKKKKGFLKRIFLFNKDV